MWPVTGGSHTSELQIRSCQAAGPAYSDPMLVHWRRLIFGLGLLAVLALVTGCSGINARGSVSPASFLLPGLVETVPNAPADHGEAPATPLLVRAH